MVTGPLFDKDRGDLLKAEGIERAGEAADRAWKAAALAAIRDLTRKRTHITADDVWEWIASRHPEARTRQPSAMGAIFKEAQADELIFPTDFFVMSERASTHRRPLRCWRCLAGEGWDGPGAAKAQAMKTALGDVDEVLAFMYPRLKGQAAMYTQRARKMIEKGLAG